MLRAIFAALLLSLASAPVAADTNGVPPGNPCLKDNGNPCKGNNGNLGRQGNANHEKTVIDKKPPPIDLAMPAISGRAAFVDQIGNDQVATIRQTAPNAFARVNQQGSSNEADVTQNGSGTAYAQAAQAGTGNFARIEQGGTGQNVVYLTQQGDGNWAWSNQAAMGALHNGAKMLQSGDGNDMSLVQQGSDNLAVLTQDGDNNGMTTVQIGDGNRLTWIQQGSNLSDLQITQTGGTNKDGQISVTQMNWPPGN